MAPETGEETRDPLWPDAAWDEVPRAQAAMLADDEGAAHSGQLWHTGSSHPQQLRRR